MPNRKIKTPFFDLAAVDELPGRDTALARPNDRSTAEADSENSVSYETIDPTKPTYLGLAGAYAFFNETLFAAALPFCLITIQRKNKAYGYFAAARFGTRDGLRVTDEIALNPSHFAERSNEATLSTLVHEMVHLQQQHFGEPSRSGYHNKQWADWMREVGLIPSSTGEPGGKATGQRVSHYIEEGGRFARACTDLIEVEGFTLRYVERWSEETRKTREKKAASKTKYVCPNCTAIVWSKPGAELDCRPCKAEFQALTIITPTARM